MIRAETSENNDGEDSRGEGEKKKVVMGRVSDEVELIFVLMFVCECYSSSILQLSGVT